MGTLEVKGNHDKSADGVSRGNCASPQPEAIAPLDEKGAAQRERKLSDPKID